MKLYHRQQYSVYKKCRTRTYHSEDYKISITALPDYIPESRIIQPDIWLILSNQFEDSLDQNELTILCTNRIINADSLNDFKKKSYKWFLEYKGDPYYLSWYTAKKIMMLAFKLYKRGLK